MKKFLFATALLSSLAWSASAQTKTTTKTKTTSSNGTTVNQTQTSQETNTQEQSSSSSSGGFFQKLKGHGNDNGNMNLDGGDIKAGNGDITLEANVNLLNGNVGLSNSLQQIRGRYFLSDDMAARLGVHLSYNTTTPTTTTKTRSIDFSIAPGIEKHFAGTDRLSPYVGAELVLGIRSAHAETDNGQNGKVEVKGSFGPADNTNQGYFLVGLGAVGGFDFYVARHLYVGYELSMELSNRSYSDIEVITTDAAGEIKTVKTDGNSAFSFGPNVRNGIRVGFVF